MKKLIYRRADIYRLIYIKQRKDTTLTMDITLIYKNVNIKSDMQIT